MRAVLTYCAITGSLLVMVLLLRNLPESSKLVAFGAILFLFTAGLMVKICRGSK